MTTPTPPKNTSQWPLGQDPDDYFGLRAAAAAVTEEGTTDDAE